MIRPRLFKGFNAEEIEAAQKKAAEEYMESSLQCFENYYWGDHFANVSREYRAKESAMFERMARDVTNGVYTSLSTIQDVYYYLTGESMPLLPKQKGQN